MSINLQKGTSRSSHWIRNCLVERRPTSFFRVYTTICHDASHACHSCYAEANAFRFAATNIIRIRLMMSSRNSAVSKQLVDAIVTKRQYKVTKPNEHCCACRLKMSVMKHADESKAGKKKNVMLWYSCRRFGVRSPPFVEVRSRLHAEIYFVVWNNSGFWLPQYLARLAYSRIGSQRTRTLELARLFERHLSIFSTSILAW